MKKPQLNKLANYFVSNSGTSIVQRDGDRVLMSNNYFIICMPYYYYTVLMGANNALPSFTKDNQTFSKTGRKDEFHETTMNLSYIFDTAFTSKDANNLIDTQFLYNVRNGHTDVAKVYYNPVKEEYIFIDPHYVEIAQLNSELILEPFRSFNGHSFHDPIFNEHAVIWPIGVQSTGEFHLTQVQENNA